MRKKTKAQSKLRIAIVVSRFNAEITERLLESAKHTLRMSADAQPAQVVRVPGVFEIPLAAKLLASSAHPPEAIVCLGAVIQGQTHQHSYLTNSCFQALQRVQLETGIPLGMGIIAAPNLRLASQRTRGELDRGREAAQAALAMARLKQELAGSKPQKPAKRLSRP